MSEIPSALDMWMDLIAEQEAERLKDTDHQAFYSYSPAAEFKSINPPWTGYSSDGVSFFTHDEEGNT